MLDKVQEQPEGVAYLRKVMEGSYRSPLLLLGIDGVGKRFSVLQAIKEALSKGDSESSAIYQVDEDIHPDVAVIASDSGKDIGIDAVRGLLSKACACPMFATYKYLVVDGADKLTGAAANAILKTLEEPPDRTRFFLLAQSAERVIPTIKSRCGHLRYRRLSEGLIFRSIKDFIPDQTKALVYARLADGSLGKAFQYFGSNRINLRDRVFSLLKTCLGGDVSTIFSAINGIEKEDLPLAFCFLNHLLYDLVMLPHVPQKIANIDVAEDLEKLYQSLGYARIRNLQKGLNELSLKVSGSSISLDYHLKACLDTVFVGQ